jgi:hypothetical protein
LKGVTGLKPMWFEPHVKKVSLPSTHGAELACC